MVQRPPRGWLEPGNLQAVIPVGIRSALHAFQNDRNPMMFCKTFPEDYEIAKTAKDLAGIILGGLQVAGASAVVDDGMYSKLVCRPEREERWLVVDPHSEKAARVTETDGKGIESMLRNGAMVLIVQRDV